MSETLNQNPEQIARDRIDQLLKEAGWLVQSKGYGSVVELLERIKRRKNRIRKPSSATLQMQ
jgi:type I site-specific restriction endonuclease